MNTNDGQQNDRILKSRAGKSEAFNITLVSLNHVETKYELIYKVCTNSTCSNYTSMPNGFAVNVSEDSNSEINGSVNAYGSRIITIVTINTSSSDIYLEIGLNAGYGWNELALDNQIYETSDFLQDDLRIISIVDGVEQKNAIFPDTGNYDVNLTCTKGGNAIPGFRGEGFWNDVDNKWELDLIGVLESGTTCNVEFIYQAIQSIAVTKNPDKMAYAPGDTFDTTGMVVTAYTATGSYNATGYTVSPSVIVADTTSITISYSTSGITRSTTLNIKVVTGISINTPPNKLSYFHGESINLNGLKLNVNYSDGSNAVLSYASEIGITISPTIANYGTTSFTIYYASYSVSQNISVLPSQSIYECSVSCKFIDDGDGNWRIAFTPIGTQTFTWNGASTKIDIFVVGGGGNSKGGGGYTNTYLNFTLDSNSSHSVVVGAGGSNQSYFSSTTYVAAGGRPGGERDSYYHWDGGNGGSGGGGYAYNNTDQRGGQGGTNGGSGESKAGSGGGGQGSTTCEFGEMLSGTIGGSCVCKYSPTNGYTEAVQGYAGLYAGGGGGDGGYGGYGGAGGGGNASGTRGGTCTNGAANTGGGGGSGCNGGSGIVIIRKHID